MDPFDRPVDWRETRSVARPATASATPESGVKPSFSPTAANGVAAVATVANGCADRVDAESVAGRATAFATAENGRKLPKNGTSDLPVATVAAVAQDVGTARSKASVANPAIVPATGRPETEGQRLAAALSAKLACHVADVATVAVTGDNWVKPLQSSDYSGLSQVAAPAAATLVATLNRGIPASPPPPSVEAWTAGVQLLRRSPAMKFYHGRWYQMVADARAFLALWAEDALRAGWGTLDVFGVNRNPLHARYDRLGLVALLKGRPVQEIGPDSATVGNSAKDVTTYYRQRRAAGGVPVWQWCLEGSQ